MKELHSTAKANKTHTHAQSDITGLSTALSGKANSSHTHAQSDITNLTSTLAAKAPLASPTLTGTPKAPTAAAGTNTTQIATTAFVTTAVSDKQTKIVTDSDGNAVKSMVVVTDSNGNIVGSAYVTTTELNMLNNVRSNIQSQIDSINAGIYPSFNTSQELEHNVAFTPTVNGLLHYTMKSDARSGGYRMYLAVGSATFTIWADDYSHDTGFIPVAAGTVIKYTFPETNEDDNTLGYQPGTARFYPCS